MMKLKSTPIKPSLLVMWWFPLLVAGVLLIGTPMVLLPMIGRIVAMNQDLKRTEENLKKAEKKIVQLRSVDEQQMGRLASLFKQALPSQKPYYQVLLLLQQLGAETGVALGEFELSLGEIASNSTRPTPKTANEEYTRIQTTLSVTGTTEQVSQFVTRLHQAIPLLVVNNITIGNSTGADLNETRHVNLELQLLYMPDPPAKKTISYDLLPPLSDEVESVRLELSQYVNPDADYRSVAPSVTNFSRTDIFNF